MNEDYASVEDMQWLLKGAIRHGGSKCRDALVVRQMIAEIKYLREENADLRNLSEGVKWQMKQES